MQQEAFVGGSCGAKKRIDNCCIYIYMHIIICIDMYIYAHLYVSIRCLGELGTGLCSKLRTCSWSSWQSMILGLRPSRLRQVTGHASSGSEGCEYVLVTVA